jgi:hypothetical protein
VTRRRVSKSSLFTIIVLLVFDGCISSEKSFEKYVAERNQQVLAAYPPGVTTRAKVQESWSHSHPDFSELRPDLGWDACPSALVRARVAASEQRSGQSIYRCERYFWAGLSGSLSYYWFYYDDRDYLVDAEWQWHTD